MPSEAIRFFAYNQETATLHVRFVSGTLYEYKQVPKEVYHAMKQATSKGRYLNKFVKGRYEYIKVNG